MLAITGGGTGGHLAGVRVLKDAFCALGIEPVFLGSSAGLDRRWLGDEPGFAARHFLPTRSVVDRRAGDLLRSLAGIAAATARSVCLLRRHGVRAVLSVGAYPAAAPAAAALLCGVPLFLHEHNAVPGRLHRLLAPRAAAVFSAFDPRSPVRDYPVEERFFASRRVRREVGRVLFLGGSQGARAINDFALAAAPLLRRLGIAVSHQTGERDHERVRARYAELGGGVDCFAFDPRLDERMARADFAVSRAGAASLFELAANGLPALFVPYPHAAGDHQFANARFLEERGLAVVARQSELSSDLLLACLQKGPEEMSRGLLARSRPGAAREIALHVLRAAGLAATGAAEAYA